MGTWHWGGRWGTPTILLSPPLSPQHPSFPDADACAEHTLETGQDSISFQVSADFDLSNMIQTQKGSNKHHSVKELFLMLAHLSGTICLKHSATLILPPLLKLPSRRTWLIIISKLFFTALPIPSSDTVCVCVCVCVWLVLL